MSELDKNGRTEIAKTQGAVVRHGVVAVCKEDNRFLVIRRSQKVRAPGMLCFPGGHIEANETFEQAMIRELEEELALPVSIENHLWSSVTSWGTHLEWLLVRRSSEHSPIPNPEEVAEVMWMTEAELLGGLDILSSVSDFFEALHAGRFRI